MRVVFDNNILISAALLKYSVPYKAFEKAINNNTILRTEKTVIELNNTVHRSKFDKYFINPHAKDEFFNSFIACSVNIEISYLVTECRDEKDNIYLELALSGKADCIVSGDKDLLVLNPFRGIPIMSPKEFLNF